MTDTEYFPDLDLEDTWALVEDEFTPQLNFLSETIFALSNGYLGVRGTLEEGHPAHAHGTFVNGYHETWPIIHPEAAYGLADTGQTIVNLPDATVLAIEIDGEELDPAAAVRFRRTLDLRTGRLDRRTEWVTATGVRVRVDSRRLVSLVERELMAFSTRVEVDRPARLLLTSRVINRQDLRPDSPDADDDPRRSASLPHRVMLEQAATVTGMRMIQRWETANSGLGLIMGIDHVLDGEDTMPVLHRDPNDFQFIFSLEVTPDLPVTLERFVVYRQAPSDHPVSHVDQILDRVRSAGFERLSVDQNQAWAEYWAMADIEVGAAPDIQRAVRWVLFQLHQASARISDTGIPAKGLTGQAYDGHYFWDTDIYILPFLIYTAPRLAAELVGFRYRMLPAARERAAVMAQRGALYPWRTINGQEASAYFLAGTAQYHIDADIVYGLRKYLEITGDDELGWRSGVEMAVETARMWADLGFFRSNRFHIHGVTGPDEYSALVDDNVFTNSMARMNLRFAADLVDRMRAEQPERFALFTESVGLGDEEPTEWRRAAEAMFIAYDADLEITPQDTAFLSKEPWDFEGTPYEKYPLLLHFHPLVIYRYQVLKQADVMLADFLLGDEFSPQVKKANFEYYDPITTGDSSLSACVQSIMAAEVGYPEKALQHFERALFMDLADLAGNTTAGVHMASAGGVWMALVYGFGGLRDHRGRLRFEPRLPESWSRLKYGIDIQDRRLLIELTHQSLDFDLAGEPLEVMVNGHPVELVPGHNRVELGATVW